MKHKKIIIKDFFYITLFFGGTVYYIRASIDYFMNTTNNYTAFTELRMVFEEAFDI